MFEKFGRHEGIVMGAENIVCPARREAKQWVVLFEEVRVQISAVWRALILLLEPVFHCEAIHADVNGRRTPGEIISNQLPPSFEIHYASIKVEALRIDCRDYHGAFHELGRVEVQILDELEQNPMVFAVCRVDCERGDFAKFITRVPR